MIWLLLIFLGITIAAVCWAVSVQQALDFAYKYAVDQAEARSVGDQMGRAYSDMATVLILCVDLDGREQIMCRKISNENEEE